MSKAVTKLRKIRLSQGLCVDCGVQPLDQNKQRCLICTGKIKTKDREWRLNRIASGICARKNCNEPIFHGSWCKTHRKEISISQKQRRKELTSNKICTGCAKNIAVKTMCVECYLKRASKKYLGDLNHWTLLENKLIAQNYRCIYSGITLQVGINASVDHILAKSKGGKNHIENLQWVHIWINKMKNDLPHDEFIKQLNTFTIELSSYRNQTNSSSEPTNLDF